MEQNHSIALKQINLETALVCLVILVTPFVQSVELLDERLLPRQLLLTIVTGALLIIFLFKRKSIDVNFKLLRWVIPLLVVFIAYGVSSYSAQLFSDAYHWWLKVGLYLSFFFVILIFIQNQRIQFRFLPLAVVLSILLSSILLLTELNQLESASGLNSEGAQFLYDIKGPFGHKNLFSSYILLGLPFVFYWLIFGNKWLKGISLLCLLLCMLIVIYLQSKAVLLGILVGGLLVLIPLLTLLKKKNLKIFKWTLACIICGSLLTGGVVISQKDKFTLLFQTNTIQERMVVWENTTQMIKEHPMMGVGGGNFQIFFPKYGLEGFEKINKRAALGNHTFQRPHNDYLWIFSEAGIFALLSYLALLVLVLYSRIRLFFKQEKLLEKLYSLTLIFALTSYSVMAFFDFPWERNEHQMIFLIVLAFSIPPENLNIKKYSNLIKTLIVLAFVVLLSFVLFNTKERMKGEKHARILVESHAQGNWNLMINEAQKCKELPYEINNLSIPIQWYKGIGQFTLGNIEAAHQSFLKAYEVNPYQIYVNNNLAGTYLKTGDFDKAIEHYDKALKIYPRHPEVLLNKSIAHYKNGKLNRSFEIFMEIDYDNSWSQMYNKAFPILFNEYLQKKIEDQPESKFHTSWKNIQKSDSIKKAIIYEYHHNNKDWKDLLDIYNYH